jgi:Skp family chaperone for outer membrane proteins
MKNLLIFILLSSLACACTPTVQVAAPKEPIEINLNVKIEHHIRVQVDKELEDIFEEDSDLF